MPQEEELNAEEVLAEAAAQEEIDEACHTTVGRGEGILEGEAELELAENQVQIRQGQVLVYFVCVECICFNDYF